MNKKFPKPIKMVVSDVDGTLIQDYDKGLDPNLFNQIRALKAQGIKVVIASGRQYNSLLKLFKEVAEDLYFVCENGGAIFYNGEIVDLCAMNYNASQKLITAIQNHPDCEVMISNPTLAYYSQPSNYFLEVLDILEDFIFEEYDDFQKIPEPIIKVTAFVHNGAINVVSDFEKPFASMFNMAVAGPNWLDFSLASKGVALDKLCQKLNIKADEMIFFGDNFNDISLLDYTPNSFAMPKSHPEVIAHARAGVCYDIKTKLDEILGSL